jgi:hypothetical protein
MVGAAERAPEYQFKGRFIAVCLTQPPTPDALGHRRCADNVN